MKRIMGNIMIILMFFLVLSDKSYSILTVFSETFTEIGDVIPEKESNIIVKNQNIDIAFSEVSRHKSSSCAISPISRTNIEYSLYNPGGNDKVLNLMLPIYNYAGNTFPVFNYATVWRKYDDIYFFKLFDGNKEIKYEMEILPDNEARILQKNAGRLELYDSILKKEIPIEEAKKERVNGDRNIYDVFNMKKSKNIYAIKFKIIIPGKSTSQLRVKSSYPVPFFWRLAEIYDYYNRYDEKREKNAEVFFQYHYIFSSSNSWKNRKNIHISISLPYSMTYYSNISLRKISKKNGKAKYGAKIDIKDINKNFQMAFHYKSIR
jgi:hypothetical protein